MSALAPLPILPEPNAPENDAYDAWLEQKVLAARAGLADGSNQRYTQDEWAAIRATKKANRAA